MFQIYGDYPLRCHAEKLPEKFSDTNFKTLLSHNKFYRYTASQLDIIEIVLNILAAKILHTLDKSKTVARRGERVAGTARKETEKELGRSIVTNQNFLPEQTKPDENK